MRIGRPQPQLPIRSRCLNSQHQPLSTVTFDTLQIAGGVERSFQNWGFARNSVKQRRYAGREDTFTATIPTANITDDPIFPFETQVIVRTGRASANGADNSFSGGTVKFQGKRVGCSPSADGSRMGVSYEFLGPWYDLANTHYLQNFKGQTVNPYAPGEIILNTGLTPNGTLLFISVADQIQAIFQFLLDQYAAQNMAAPFQYAGRALNPNTKTIDLSAAGSGPVGVNSDKSGNQYVYKLQGNSTIDAALFSTFYVSYIAKPMMCSQALQKMLELSPRTNICFDYSTTPPTVYVRSVDNFAPANLALLNGIDHKSINIKRRDDLVARAVVITYRITGSTNGQQYVDAAVDKWGPNGANSPLDPSAGLRVLSETIDLQGFSETTTTATLDCEPLALIGGNNASKRAFWSSRRGGEQAKFLDSRLRFQNQAGIETVIPDGVLTYADNDAANGRVAGQPLSPADLALFTHRIVKGTYHVWMAGGNNPIFSIKVRASVKTEHALYDVVATGDALNQLPANESASNTAVNGNRHGKPNTEETHTLLELTNASNINGVPFSATTAASSTPGELALTGALGIAAYLFNALQKPQYEGEYAKVESDFANNVNLTNALNLTNGRAEWANMNAQIQEISEDWGTKETSVKIGPVSHLSAGQLSSLLNMWAFRRPWYNPALRADNTVPNGGEVSMPQNSGGANGVAGLTNYQDFVTTDYQTPSDPTSTVNGQIKLTAPAITAIQQNTNPNPRPGFTTDDTKTIQPRAIQCCDDSGAVVTAIILATGFYV